MSAVVILTLLSCQQALISSLSSIHPHPFFFREEKYKADLSLHIVSHIFGMKRRWHGAYGSEMPSGRFQTDKVTDNGRLLTMSAYLDQLNTGFPMYVKFAALAL